jgi:hypothetical protein
MIEKRRYLSYLLRLWQDSGGDLPGDEPAPWRASLEIPQSGDRLGFASLADLFAFLENKTGPPAMPGRQGAPICQAPRERTDTGEEVM